MHEIVDRSVQLVARNHEARTEVESFVQQVARYKGIVNRVPRLIRSCNKLHATFEMNNALDG